MTHFVLKEWSKVKNVFKKPIARFYFGKWVNDPCLPVWRRGPVIHLFDKHQHYDMHTNCDAWNEGFKEKLEKWHLGWLKPTYELPMWLSFHIYNFDVMWKTKYTNDNICYEFPPQFTIVFFGLSFSIHWHAPVENNERCINDDDYWTSLLYYSHCLMHTNSEADDAMSLTDKLGYWTTKKKDADEYEFVVNPDFFKSPETLKRLVLYQDYKMGEIIKEKNNIK